MIDERILAHALAASKDGRRFAPCLQESPRGGAIASWRRGGSESYFLDEGKWADAPLTRTLTVCYDEAAGAGAFHRRGEHPRHGGGADRPRWAGGSFVGCLQDALRAAVEVSRGMPARGRDSDGRRVAHGVLPAGLLRGVCGRAGRALPRAGVLHRARAGLRRGRVDERLSLFRQEVASIAHGEKLSVAVNASAHELYEPVAKALFDIAQESTLRRCGFGARAAWTPSRR